MRSIRNLMLPLVFIAGLSGCLNYHQEVSLYPDGSGTMHIHYWTGVADSAAGMSFGPLALFNEDSVRAIFTSPAMTLEKVSVQRDTTSDTMHCYISFSFEHIDSLNGTRAFPDTIFSLQEGAAGQQVFTQFIQPGASGFGMDASQYSVTYVYDFPGEIITHNATSVGKRKLTWSYTMAELGRGKTIVVTYRPYKIKETPIWIYALSGVVLLVVIVFLFRKRRN